MSKIPKPSSFDEIDKMSREDLIKLYDQENSFMLTRDNIMNAIRYKEQEKINQNMLVYTERMDKAAKTMKNLTWWIFGFTVLMTILTIVTIITAKS